MHTFSCKTKIISGPGAAATLKDLGIARLFLVTDPYFMKNGQAQRIAEYTGAKETEFFPDIVPDPSVELAATGTARLKAFQPDTVIALGGGSAMDTAKAMVYFAGHPLKLVAIPTTSGSGSEVTDFSILTHDGVKHPLVDSRILPDVAILDSDLLSELPKKLIADTGFDVITHALEAYVATGAGAITDALAADAFSATLANLRESFSGNTDVRLRVHTAATMAGMAFTQAGLGLCHAIAHTLGGLFHIPHGRLGAILLPEVVECNAHAASGKYAKLARFAGLGGSADTMAVRNLKNALIRLRKDLGMPATLREAGVDPYAVRKNTAAIVESALKDPCCKTNPLLVEDYMVRRILSRVTGDG